MAPALTLPQKILFTAVFTVYWFIFYGIAYYAVSWWDPALLAIPERLGQTHVLTALGIFTALVFLAYAGAGFVVLGRLPGSDPDRDSNFRPRRRGPAPGDRLRSSRRFFGSRGDNAPAPPSPKRPSGRPSRPGPGPSGRSRPARPGDRPEKPGRPAKRGGGGGPRGNRPPGRPGEAS